MFYRKCCEICRPVYLSYAVSALHGMDRNLTLAWFSIALKQLTTRGNMSMTRAPSMWILTRIPVPPRNPESFKWSTFVLRSSYYYRSLSE